MKHRKRSDRRVVTRLSLLGWGGGISARVRQEAQCIHETRLLPTAGSSVEGRIVSEHRTASHIEIFVVARDELVVVKLAPHSQIAPLHSNKRWEGACHETCRRLAQ
ncbi:hypothetical protein CY34DRAFT_394356 [Suillus luteus UH-Slu-Lm8-n1]|uniref:Uncharacterized protein n=1 Tax=Suillus luteus UH-Slu-Lm8-n1 TaxID=930992 RepID=A0A0D0A9I0_9AGAM|nr:hypothetical protein CY34DRAFT_394356 [Suillus luteus UH-Slu-Lm8-n1]